MGKTLDSCFPIECIQMSNRYVIKWSLLNREMQIKSTVIYYFMTVRIAVIKRAKYLTSPRNTQVTLYRVCRMSL